METAIVDSSVMFGAINTLDRAHSRCRDLLSSGRYSLVFPVLCITEVVHLVGRDLGPHVESGFVRSLAAMQVYAPGISEWARIADLVSQYAGFPLGTVDASVIALAERMNAQTIFTLDRRHFSAVKPAHVPAFELLP